MDSFETLVVGEKDCIFKDVVNVLFNEVNSDIVCDNWSQLARALDIQSHKIKKWRQNVLLDLLPVKEVLHEILESWKTEKGNEATLANLLKHLEKIDFNKVADELRKFFSLKAIFQVTLPNKAKYYISRTLVTRRVIDERVFSSTRRDVFVLYKDGFDPYPLNQLLQEETDTSTSQVSKDRLSVQIILLQNYGDWALLCDKSTKTTKPIHLLRHHEGKFHWVCTKGDISALQKASEEKDQDELSEEEFIDKFEADLQFKTNQPILISDSPGMGKSLLLASIGRQLQQRYPQRFIAFIIISEFVVKINELLPDFKNTEEAMLETLLRLLCKNNVAREQLLQKIKTPTESPSTQIELMFDGFDEVSTKNFGLANECLKILKTDFNSTIRVWVTTRPQHLHELEQCFSVLGMKIQAFQEKHQIDFLTSFWNSQRNNLHLGKLQDFSRSCLSTLKEKLNKKDEDIAGIPLQCMMIGEVYSHDANRFCRSVNERIDKIPAAAPCIEVNSITELYEKMIQHKIKKFETTYSPQPEEMSQILPWHMYLALELIFPSHAHKFKDTLKINSGLKPDYLVNIGILERRGGTTEDQSRFVHRTFAEYLAARFFVSDIISHSESGSQNPGGRLPNVLFKNVLECSVAKRQYFWPSRYFPPSFTHSVLCHFLNSLLYSQLHIFTENFINLKSIRYTKNIFYACIHSGFGNIVKLVRSLKHPFQFLTQYMWYLDSEIFIDATRKASLDLLKFILETFKHKPLTSIKGNNHPRITPLHAAVRRGSYTIFKYILKEHHFENLVKEGGKFLNLVHHAVCCTVHHDADEIQDRVLIVTALCDLDQEMLKYCDNRNQTPLLADRVHIKLLKTLIECRANLFHLDYDKNTILHKATQYLSATDYFDLLQFIPKTTLNSLLQVRDRHGVSPIHLIVKRGLANADILQLILSHGVDINTSDDYGRTCIFDAVCMENEGMRIPTVKLLLENGADQTRLTSNGDSIIHHSAKWGRFDCLRFFFEEKKMNVNLINKKGETPIFSAAAGLYSPLQTVEFLLERGAEYKIVNKRDENLLHYATEEYKLECLKLFLTLGGLDINLANEDGNTPLLCAFDRYNEHRVEMVRLLLANGADPTVSNKNGNNVLHRAAARREAQCISELVGFPSVDVNGRNCDNYTALHLVIEGIGSYVGDDDLLELLSTFEALVSLGADVNARNNQGKTPLAMYKEKTLNCRFKGEELKTDLEIRRLLKGSARKSRPNKM